MFEPMPPGAPFGHMMNAPKKYVVSGNEKPFWRDTTIIRDNVIESVRGLKAEAGLQPLLPHEGGAGHTAEPSNDGIS